MPRRYLRQVDDVGLHVRDTGLRRKGGPVGAQQPPRRGGGGGDGMHRKEPELPQPSSAPPTSSADIEQIGGVAARSRRGGTGVRRDGTLIPKYLASAGLAQPLY